MAATRRLLAVSGKRFSGKDTFAAALVEHARRRGVTLATYAFADQSKRLFVAEEAQRGVTVDLARLLGDRAYKEQWRPRLTAFTVAAIAADPLVFCREVVRRVEASPQAVAMGETPKPPPRAVPSARPSPAWRRRSRPSGRRWPTKRGTARRAPRR